MKFKGIGIFTVVLWFGLALASCKSNQAGGGTIATDTPPVEDSVSNTIPTVTIDRSLDRLAPNDNFNVQSLTIEDSIFTVALTYSGGCKEHSFEMFSDGNYAKSWPPQLTLFLKHEGNEDHCRMMIVDTLRFDVSNVKYHKGNELILRMNNAKQTVRYIY